tara:strand:- start:649 stop:1050 length:402 start_codon:yes stop_codon:yes gene_type:complete
VVENKPTIITSKLTLGSIIALIPLVGVMFAIDSRYISTDEVVVINENVQTIADDQMQATMDVSKQVKDIGAHMRIGLAEIRIELYQERLDNLTLMPTEDFTDYHRKRKVVLERGVAKYEKIIDLDTRLLRAAN